jgi:hypothetical protein
MTTLQPWQFEKFEDALHYALDWQVQGKITMSVIKVADIYEASATDKLPPEANVVAQLRTHLYVDYIQSRSQQSSNF